MQPVGYKRAMSDSAAANEPVAQYISVNELPYEPADGCVKTFRKCLLKTDRLTIHQSSIRGRGDAEDYGVCDTNRAAYVLSGTATLKSSQAERSDTPIRKGQLIVIPAGARWGAQLCVQSEELVLLEVTELCEGERTATTSEPGARVYVVSPEEIATYEPAGHAKTRNRCLFVDEHMELIEGLIERGGGADRHAHSHNEQMLYVLGDVPVPLLIYYPKGAPHGTGGGLPEPLALLVIYSPPLGESQHALA
jgi:mannose-6-phosphate isomerase-like protein (cupin superfamily)